MKWILVINSNLGFQINQNLNMKRSILKIIDLKSWLVFGSAYYSKDKKLELAIYHYKNNRDTSTITVIFQLLNYIYVCVCVCSEKNYKYNVNGTQMFLL